MKDIKNYIINEYKTLTKFNKNNPDEIGIRITWDLGEIAKKNINMTYDQYTKILFNKIFKTMDSYMSETVKEEFIKSIKQYLDKYYKNI